MSDPKSKAASHGIHKLNRAARYLRRIRNRTLGRPKVVCLGLNKTGTSSLYTAFQALGLIPHHGPHKFNKQVERAIREGRKMLHYLDEYDAFMDIFLPYGFDTDPILSWRNRSKFLLRLESEYPNNKYILNTRCIDDWLDSRESHVQRNRRSTNYNGRWRTVDRDGWKTEWDMHHGQILNYFDKRPHDLLVIDVTQEHSWERLCMFLHRRIPNMPFPQKNITGH